MPFSACHFKIIQIKEPCRTRKIHRLKHIQLFFMYTCTCITYMFMCLYKYTHKHIMQKSIHRKGILCCLHQPWEGCKNIKKDTFFPPKHGDVVKRLACMFAPDTGLHPAEMNFKIFLLLCCNSE